jgi:hypothetical protein
MTERNAKPCKIALLIGSAAPPLRSIFFSKPIYLADAPDLGLQNHRFQSVVFHFKLNAFCEWKTGFSYEIVAVANGE